MTTYLSAGHLEDDQYLSGVLLAQVEPSLVTSVGTGSCNITISDTKGNTAAVSVTVN